MGHPHPALLGGSDVQSFSTTTTHNLIDHARWGVYVLSGTGVVTFALPNALGLPPCTTFHLSFSGSGMTAEFDDYDGGAISLLDNDGNTQTDIDFSPTPWGLSPGLIIILKDNSTTAGTWRAFSWSDYQ